jgi:hypothetical protein
MQKKVTGSEIMYYCLFLILILHFFRSAHTEMKLCKDQIAETQSLKKRAMATLLHAFKDFQLSVS